MSDKRISELFGYVCKHCGDPKATHEPKDLEGCGGMCFIMSCNCPGFELDNLKYLEELSE